MFRLSGLLSLALAFLFGAILFWTSQSVQDAERHLKDKKNQLAQEEEAIRVLSTEWDYLNRPQRLEDLAAHGVGMDTGSDEKDANASVGIVSSVDDIPEPVVPAMPVAKPASLSRIEPAASEEKLPSYERDSFQDILNELDSGGAQ